MNSQEDFNALEYNNQAYNYIYYYDKISELISIPYIYLYYTDSDIIIKSYCTNNHESNLPLNEFLIKYHPLYKKYKNYEFCHKCWIKLFYAKRYLIHFLLVIVIYVINIFVHIIQSIHTN